MLVLPTALLSLGLLIWGSIELFIRVEQYCEWWYVRNIFRPYAIKKRSFNYQEGPSYHWPDSTLSVTIKNHKDWMTYDMFYLVEFNYYTSPTGQKRFILHTCDERFLSRRGHNTVRNEPNKSLGQFPTVTREDCVKWCGQEKDQLIKMLLLTNNQAIRMIISMLEEGK